MADERTDQALAQDSLAGNRCAFEELVRRHQDAVFGLAASLARNREDAEDMAQEAFIRAYGKLEQYNPEYSFKAWLLRICANQTKNLFRSRTRRRRAEEGHVREAEVRASEQPADYGELEVALARLPPKLGAPLRLKHMEGLPYEEIAAILGIGVSAAKMRTLRARNLLMEMLQP